LAESDTASVAGAGSLPAVRSKTFGQKYKPTFVQPDLQKNRWPHLHQAADDFLWKGPRKTNMRV
jgi:hypothetical protein